MLLAEGVVYLDRVLKPRVPSLARSAILTTLVAAITVRFALFAMANVASFNERTQTYRNYTAHFREIHGDVPSHTTVAPDARLTIKMPHRFVNAAVQWEYRDPTIQITPYEYTP
jgi:7-keto-8-aminopelargonate synthetase-like enzyme